MDREEVIIIGGGVTGCAIAFRLAADYNVRLLEKGQIAGEASGLAAGNTTIAMALPRFSEVAKVVENFYINFDGTGDFTYHRKPRVGFLREELVETKREDAAFLSNRGIPVKMYTREEVEGKYPRFDVGQFAAAIEYQYHGWVDPYTLTTTYRKEAEKRGAEIETQTRVNGLTVEDGEISGVSTEIGEFHSDHVVSAVGWRTPELLKDHVSVPVKPVVAQALTLETPWDDGWESDFPIGHIEHEGMYFRPELNGDLLVGGGFHPTDHPEPMAKGVAAEEKFIDDVARIIPTILPDLSDTQINNDWAGIAGMVPDFRPIIDVPEGGPDNLVIAQASEMGFASSPFISLGVRCLIADENCPFSLDDFSLSRFGDQENIWDKDSLPVYFQSKWSKLT